MIGGATDIGVPFTANGAYMRDLRVVVPADGVALNGAADRDAALVLMWRVLKADTLASATIDFAELSARQFTGTARQLLTFDWCATAALHSRTLP